MSAKPIRKIARPISFEQWSSALLRLQPAAEISRLPSGEATAAVAGKLVSTWADIGDYVPRGATPSPE